MSASEALQHEIERLEEVCERLDVLADGIRSLEMRY